MTHAAYQSWFGARWWIAVVPFCLLLVLPACSIMDELQHANLRGEGFTGANADMGRPMRPGVTSGQSTAITTKGRQIDKNFGYR